MIYRRNNLNESKMFRCICGAKIDVNVDDNSALILMNKKDKYLNQRLLLCLRCSYELIKWINKRYYINKQAEIEEYKKAIFKMPPTIQNLLDQVNEVNASMISTPNNLLESVLRGINDNEANNESLDNERQG